MRILSSIGFLFLFMFSSIAHEEYTDLRHPRTNVLCCNERDCAPLDDSRVKEVNGGYQIDGKHFVPFKDVIPSWDGKFHGCFWPKLDDLRCFIAPQGGF